VRDRPILFSAPMVRALIAGTKTQTRRLIPEATQDAYYEYDDWCRNVSAGVPTSRQWEKEFFLERRRIQPGDRLWVREAWRTWVDDDHLSPRQIVDIFEDPETSEPGDKPTIQWQADGAVTHPGATTLQPGRLRASMHLPRILSRLTLIVTDVRVQRLQDISEEDARAEGAYIAPRSGRVADDYVSMALAGAWFATARGWYADLWNRINGPGSWAANPWVAAYTFEVHQQNIDAMEKAA